MALRAAGGALVRFKIKHEGPETYGNMWQKIRAIWKYISFHYKDDFDWFVLGGDDLFMIVENLRKVWHSASYRAKLRDFLRCRAFAVGLRDELGAPAGKLIFCIGTFLYTANRRRCPTRDATVGDVRFVSECDCVG